MKIQRKIKVPCMLAKNKKFGTEELTHHGQVAEKPRDLRELIKIFLQESKNCAKLVFSQEIMHLIPIVLSCTI